MHGPSLIVAEWEETDKQVSAVLEGFLRGLSAVNSLDGVARVRTGVCAGAAQIELR
jgi:hypothetical protein